MLQTKVAVVVAAVNPHALLLDKHHEVVVRFQVQIGNLEVTTASRHPAILEQNA